MICSVLSIAQPVTLRIDPAGARSGTASQIFDTIKYIPLETTKESLFGDISKLIITKKYFIIFDNNTHSILMFNKTGKFHAKITSKKWLINSFIYQEDKNRILVYYVNIEAITPKIQEGFRRNPAEAIKSFRRFVDGKFYDLDGNQLRDTVPKLTYISLSEFNSTRLSPRVMASTFFMADENLPDSTAYQLNIYKDHHIYKSWFPYNTKKDIARNGKGRISKSETNSSFYYTRPLDYTIYQLTADTIVPVWKFIFPMQNTVPESFYSDSTASNEELEKTFRERANARWIVNLSSIRLINDLLLFKTDNNENNFDKSNSFIYNLKSGALISVNKITPDVQNYYLPFLGKGFKDRNFETQEGGYLYTRVSSLEMFHAKEKTADKHPEYPPVLVKYFENESRKSNPVIVQLKPKESL